MKDGKLPKNNPHANKKIKKPRYIGFLENLYTSLVTNIDELSGDIGLTVVLALINALPPASTSTRPKTIITADKCSLHVNSK